MIIEEKTVGLVHMSEPKTAICHYSTYSQGLVHNWAKNSNFSLQHIPQGDICVLHHD
jgi:hypothetical protein